MRSSGRNRTRRGEGLLKIPAGQVDQNRNGCSSDRIHKIMIEKIKSTYVAASSRRHWVRRMQNNTHPAGESKSYLCKFGASEQKRNSAK